MPNLPGIQTIVINVTYYVMDRILNTNLYYYSDCLTLICRKVSLADSGAGTNCAPPLFLALQVQLVVWVSAFVMGSRPTVWSVSCLLFFYPRFPCA